MVNCGDVEKREMDVLRETSQACDIPILAQNVTTSVDDISNIYMT